MSPVWATVCRATDQESGECGNARTNRPIALGADFALRHCPCSAGFRNLASTVREREICSGAAPSRGHTQKKGRLTIQCDELWSFVNNKGNKQWVWLALDAITREKQLVFISVQEMRHQFRVCGTLYLQFIVNVQLLIPTFRLRFCNGSTK